MVVNHKNDWSLGLHLFTILALRDTTFNTILGRGSYTGSRASKKAYYQDPQERHRMAASKMRKDNIYSRVDNYCMQNRLTLEGQKFAMEAERLKHQVRIFEPGKSRLKRYFSIILVEMAWTIIISTANITAKCPFT